MLVSVQTVIFTQIGCQNREEPVTREAELERGFALMDQNRYGEAIVYFEEMLARDNHYHVKLALASAYAGRAGVKIEHIYSFAVVKEVPAPALEVKGLTLDKQSLLAVESLGKYATHWNRIPDVQTTHRNDLLAALKVLEGDEVPGVRLYAASLRVVVLKSSIQQGIENFKLRIQNKVCTSDVKPYVAWTGKVFEGLLELVDDLEWAFPEQKESYQNLRLQITTTHTQLKNLSWPASETCYALQ